MARTRSGIAELDKQIQAYSGDIEQWSTCNSQRSGFANSRPPSDQTLRTPTGSDGEK